jgi:hypothetical protein
MDLITFVSDRGSNFVKGLQSFKVLHCVAHRLNNILKATFYQQSKKKKKMKVTPSKTISKIIIETEKTPTKMTKKTTTTTTTTTSKEGSPEIDCYYMDEEENHNDSDSTEESSEDEEDDDGHLFLIDYTTTTLDNLPQSAKHILQTIEDCKSLVTHVKKVFMNGFKVFHSLTVCLQASLNREIQNQNQTTISTGTVTCNSSSAVRDRAITSTTLHQSSIIRRLSLSDLLESIKRSCDALRIILAERKEEHRIDKINMTTVQQLIDFLQSWKCVLCEVQKGNSPSLFAVLPCIAFLKADLMNREKKEKQGIDINVVGFCF